MARQGWRRIPPIAIIIGIAALFVLPLLFFIGQIGIVVVGAILLIVIAAAGLFSRLKSPSD